MGEIAEKMKLQVMKDNSKDIAIRINDNDTTKTSNETLTIDIPKDYFSGTIQFTGDSFEERMKAYCSEFGLVDDAKLKYYVDLLGKERIKALSYKEANLKREIELLASL